MPNPTQQTSETMYVMHFNHEYIMRFLTEQPFSR